MHRRASSVFPAICAFWALLWTSGCGPSAGGSCNALQYVCGSGTTALECRDSTWVEIPCRGDNGCKVQDGRVRCDQTFNQPGDLCPLTEEGQATCKTPALDALLECRSGTLIQTRSCSSCFGSGNQIVCQP